MRIRYTARLLGAALLLTFLGSLSAVHAQPAPEAEPTPDVLSLARLLDDVRTANPTLRAARLQADALATRPRQVSALPDPSVSVSYRPFGVTGIDGVLPGQVALQQMIPFPGKLRLAGEAAAYGAQMAAHDADELALDLSYQVKEAYYELFRIQEQDRLLEAFQAQLVDFEKAAAAKYEVGTGMQQAILKAQLEKNTLARRRLDLAAMRREQVERLARLTNQPGLAVGAAALVLERPPLVPTAAADPADALLTRPEVQALQAGLNMADAEIAMAKREYLPDFMVGAGIMDMMGPAGEAMPVQNVAQRFGIEFGVVIPFQRGRRDAAVQEAQLRRQELEARYEAAQTEIRTMFNEIQNRLAEDRRALSLYEETLVPQAETTLEATLSAYTTGRTDFLDLLDAERMLFDLKMDYEETYADYARTRAALERTLGVDALPVAAR